MAGKMNSFGLFRAIRFCTLGVLTLGVLVAPVDTLVAAIQSGTAIETPDPYYKGAVLEPIKIAPASPPQISRSYNFQPAAPSGMTGPLTPLAPVASTPVAPTRVATSPFPAVTSPSTAPNMTKPIKGPVIIPPLKTSDLWNAPKTPVSSTIQNVPQPGFSQPVNPPPNSFSAEAPSFPNPVPSATIQSVSPVVASPTVAPQSIIREQPASVSPNQFSPNQFSPNQFPPVQPSGNDFQPMRVPTNSQPSIQSPPKPNNDFNPGFSLKKSAPSTTTGDVIADSQVQQASFISTQDDEPSKSKSPSQPLESPSQQLIKQVGFVQPVPTPLKQDESAVAFEAGKVVAIVGGEPIFVGDMLFEINQIVERYIKKAPEEVKARERQKMISQILPKFVEAKLLYHGMLSELPEGVDIDEVLQQAASEFDSKAMPRMMESAGVESATQFDALPTQPRVVAA